MDINLIIDIIYLIVIAIFAIIVFRQNTTIKNVKSFMDIFDIKKVKEYTDLMVEGEQKKHQIEKESLTNQINELMEEKDIKLDKIERLFKDIISAKEQISTVKNFLSTFYQINFGVAIQLYSLSLGCFSNLSSKSLKTLTTTEEGYLNSTSEKILQYYKILSEVDDNMKKSKDIINSNPQEAFEQLKQEGNKIINLRKDIDKTFEELNQFESDRRK